MLSLLAKDDVWRVAIGANALAVERIARTTANTSDGECMAWQRDIVCFVDMLGLRDTLLWYAPLLVLYVSSVSVILCCSGRMAARVSQSRAVTVPPRISSC